MQVDHQERSADMMANGRPVFEKKAEVVKGPGVERFQDLKKSLC